MKKIVGVILLILGVFLALSNFLLGTKKILEVILNWSFEAYQLGYNIGQLLFVILFGFLSYWLIKKGLYLFKS